jgi:hypothetical protein
MVCCDSFYPLGRFSERPELYHAPFAASVFHHPKVKAMDEPTVTALHAVSSPYRLNPLASRYRLKL